MEQKHTLTPEGRELINRTIASIDKEISYCTKRIEVPILVKCNRIICTPDGKYQVGVDENGHATVLVGNYTNPVELSFEAALDLLDRQGFKASNGFGELHFGILGVVAFYKMRREKLQDARESIASVLNW